MEEGRQAGPSGRRRVGKHRCGVAVTCISEATNAGPTGPGPTNGGRVPTADQLFRPDRGAAIAAGVCGVPRRPMQAEWEKIS